MDFLSALFKIALPIILQNLLSSFVNMLDTIMIGQFGSTDIAAVGLGNQIFFVMSIMMFGICSGGSIFITQFWGKKDMDGVHRSTGITLCACFIIALLFTTAGAFFPEFLLGLYTKDPAVIERGKIYLRTVSPCYIFTGISIAFGNALRSTERPKIPMIATMISVCVNTSLNYLLIFGLNLNGHTIIPRLEIQGAAIATVISRIIEMTVCLALPYIRKYEVAASPKRLFRYQSGFIPRYIKIALPVLINESLWGIGISVQNSIYGHAGTTVLAAISITGTISGLLWTFFIGCGNASAILIGKKIGESLYDEAKKLANRLTAFMTLSACVIGLFLIPLAFLLKFLFKVEPEVLHMAQVFLFITVLMYPLYSINMVTVVGVCRSGGDTLFALLIDVGFMWFISLPLGFLAVKLWHLPFWGIFLCVASENPIKCALGLIRLKTGKWLHDVTL